ncbi:hypothetical protein BOTBODRAFT_27340 [Botryobasidium botryosum FD-172 SS1]|uniref:Uncharacterized protein n=1 Tax=Botryobasidium botryosum (strain FD-172 SS1) TaxID=930990 RepID=A0A067MZ06_BOTB1|nr:hypothetical protein BOTBODRAFT_27340 [Botryobasidium botryosum FD-172 SS1]
MDGTSSKKFSPHHCIAKLLSLDKHIQSITQVALSRRLSPYLRTSTFNPIPVPPYTVAYESVAPTVEDVQAAIRENIGVADSNDEYETVVKDTTKRVKTPAVYDAELNAHCGCSLLAYHLKHPRIVPLRYIGVSKSLCFACQTFFTLYNQHARAFGQAPFCFKAANWKLYPRWVFLHFGADDTCIPKPVTDLLDKVRTDMIATIKIWLQVYVREKSRERVVSDSTAASRELPTVGIRQAEEAKHAEALTKVAASLGW